jgi:integrase/recombinase XerD
VFRRIGAPHGRLHPATLSGIVYRACDRAGVARVGTHRLRHTAATLMLRAGGSLSEIAQVLRHQSPNTTAIYAKVDDRMLGELARPWPGGVS